MNRVRALLGTLVWLLPPHPAKNRLLRWFGHRVHADARVGVCLFVGSTTVDIGAHSVVGHGNAFRGLRELRLGADTIIGQLNWFSTAPSLRPGEQVHGCLVLADHAVITNRHYVDCSGGVSLGEFATIGGVRSTVLSHSVDLDTGRQTLAPVRLDRDAFVSTNCTVLAGAELSRRAVLATGAVTALGGRYAENTLYGGVPAKPIRPIDGAYFHRERAWIGQ